MANEMTLSDVKSRADLLDFARQRGYKTNGKQLPLDFYKKEINLVNFAIDAMGYKPKEEAKASHRAFGNQRWVYLKREQEKFGGSERPENTQANILIGRRRELPNSKNFRYNDHYYFSRSLAHEGTRKEQGSIIDLVQLHMKNADLKSSLRFVENFLINNEKIKQYAAKNHIAASEVDAASETKRLKEYHNVSDLTDSTFLTKNRGISEDTINAPEFKGTIFNVKSEKGNFQNTAFPINSERGLIGFEVRNEGFKSVLDYKHDGVWTSQIDREKPVTKIVVTESAIDSLSHYQLHNKKSDQPEFVLQENSNNFYVSTAGNVSPRQIQLIDTLVNKGVGQTRQYLDQVPEEKKKDVWYAYDERDYNSKLVIDENTGKPRQIAVVGVNKPAQLSLGFDNDVSGDILAIKFLGKLPASEAYTVQNNDALKNASIHPTQDRRSMFGRVIWEFNDEKNPKNTEDAVFKLAQHIDNLNKTHKDKLSEGIPFQMKTLPVENGKSAVQIEFPNLVKAWDLMVDSVKDVKFNKSEKIVREKALTKDWNDDLRGKMKMDARLERQYNMARKRYDTDQLKTGKLSQEEVVTIQLKQKADLEQGTTKKKGLRL